MSPISRASRVVRVSLALSAVGVAGCESCHASKPYTPYTLGDSGSPALATDAGLVLATDGGEAFGVLAASPAPSDGKSWPLGAGAAEPPAGHAFVEGLVTDVDGDGVPDLVAWARSPDGARGELWFASGKSPASGRVLAALPGDLGQPTCKAKTSLSRIGAGMLAFDDEVKCEAVDAKAKADKLDKGAAGRMSRWIAIFRTVSGGAPELGLELRFAHAAESEGETLRVALDGRDRDGDGRGDLTATFTLEGSARSLFAGGSASATLAFFDRSAGLSRDPVEPEASFKAIGATLVTEGRKKTTAARVGPAARAARRLRALLCEDDGRQSAGVTMSAGAIRCGEGKLGEETNVAEVEAAINLGDPFAAVAALGRIETKRKDVDTLVAKSIPSIAGKRVHTTTVDADLVPGPAYGPVAILSTGDLLVRARDRIVKVEHASFDESPVQAALEWPARVGPHGANTPSGWKLTSIEDHCDAPTLVAGLQIGAEGSTIALPVASSRCGADPAPVDVLGTTTQGALVSVRGELVTFPLDGSPPVAALAETLAVVPDANQELGAARSASGRVVALSSARGVLVATLKGSGRAATGKLWTSPASDHAAACVPSDAADRIACVVKGKVAIYDAK